MEGAVDLSYDRLGNDWQQMGPAHMSTTELHVVNTNYIYYTVVHLC